MDGVTIILAILTSGLIFALRPIYSLIIYVAVIAWYPPYLALTIGPANLTVSRVLMMAIFIKLMAEGRTASFRMIWIDKLVIIFWISMLGAGLLTTVDMASFIVNRIGAGLDLILPYFAVRILLRKQEEYAKLLIATIVILVPLAFAGIYESITGNNAFVFMKQYNYWRPDDVYEAHLRYGFYRAEVTFPMSIMYGLFCAIFTVICTGAIHIAQKYKTLIIAGIAVVSLGCLASVSSGAVLALIVGAAFIAFYYKRKYWKPVVGTMIVMCCIVEVLSNRHFYDVLGDFTLDPSTSWYRSQLINVALFQGGMSDHWVVGFGNEKDPGWHEQIDGRDHTDMVNHYLLVLSQFGLVSFIPYIAINYIAGKRLVQAFRAAQGDAQKWYVWCVAAAFIGLLSAFMSVSLFDQTYTAYFMILALCASMPEIVRAGAKAGHDKSLTEIRKNLLICQK